MAALNPRRQSAQEVAANRLAAVTRTAVTPIRTVSSDAPLALTQDKVLDALVRSSEPMFAAEISDATGIPKNTLSSALTRIHKSGLVDKRRIAVARGGIKYQYRINENGLRYLVEGPKPVIGEWE